jgi:hypothetical protein
MGGVFRWMTIQQAMIVERKKDTNLTNVVVLEEL